MANEKTIKFEIATPERVVLKQEIIQLAAPTESGEITILPSHIPLVSILKPGVLDVKLANGQTEIISVSGGCLEVMRDKIVILADSAEMGGELDEELIAAAKKKAEEAKEKAKHEDHYDLSLVAARLEVEMAREKALHKWRRLQNSKQAK